jgi:hypothetical protein
MAQGDLQLVSGEDGRPHVGILDPEYPKFIEKLTRQAFEREVQP